MDVFLKYAIGFTKSGLRITIASDNMAPFFVAPNERASIPASVVNARKGTPRAAAALEIRAPSK